MKLSNDTKAILKAVLPLIVAIILSIIVGNIGISKITDLRNQISQAQADQNALSQKVSVLQSISANSGTLSAVVATALPDSNTTLAVFSQLKNISAVNAITISNLKAGSEVKDPNGLSKVDVSFQLSGTRDQITSFLKSIPTLAPIMKVSSIKLNESAGVVNANIVVVSFWAALPSSIPPSTQAINQLTPDENAVITNIQSLTPPGVGAAPAPQPGGKTDPFATSTAP